MISLKHLKIVQDAAEIELAMWDGDENNTELYDSAVKKLQWVQDKINELKLDSDICPLCNKTGKSISGEEPCEVCLGNGYIEFDE